MSTANILTFFVNGKKVCEENPNPEWTLLYYLRKKLGLTGSKFGCGEGGCGACTVMVSKFIRKDNIIKHYPVNACLAPLCSMHGLAVTTVEGIGSTKTRLHPVQERIAKAHGSQCGFCTPGIVMSMYTLLRQMGKPSMKDLEVAFQGNLCRCTGYRPIIEAYKTFTEDWEMMRVNGQLRNGNACAMGDKCCKLSNGNRDDEDSLHNPSEFVPYDPSQEPIFPAELKITDKYDKESLKFQSKLVTWFRPTSLKELLELKSKFPEAKIVVGNTEIGVEVKFKNQLYPILIQPTFIPELSQFTIFNDGIIVGASLSLNDFETELKNILKTEPEYKTRVFKAILEMLHWFAGKQIRSVASLGGNIMTGSPISDLNPLFMAARASLTLQSSKGIRKVPMDEKFYIGYRKTLATSDEILLSMELPFTKEKQFFFGHKQARRRDDDIAIVNAGMNITLNGINEIEDINMAFGGLAPTTILTKKTKKLIGMQWNEQILEKAYDLLLEDLPLSAEAPGGMVDYRRTLPISFFYKTYLNISNILYRNVNSMEMSALQNFEYKPLKSSQLFRVAPNEHKVDTIGRPIPHNNGFKHATGEAAYTDDILEFERELHMAFVYSTKSHAKVLSIDFSRALKMENVVDHITANDIPDGKNKCGALVKDEEFIVSKVVTSQYQVLGAILAKDQLSAQKAAKAVQVTYEELHPTVVSIEDAIEHESYFPLDYKLNFGEPDEVFKECDHILDGELRTGYQEHFYMEPHGLLVVPKESHELDVYCTAQNHSNVAEVLGDVLGIQLNKITIKVKRIGGGFGGKEVPCNRFVVPVAIAARKLNRPIRLVLDRDEDMASTGGRHPFLFKYKFGFNKEGRILAGDFKIYVNSGYSYDGSLLVLRRAAIHINNSCNVKNVKIHGFLCKTNLPTNTAFRGFGLPQAQLVNETILREVAEFLDKDYMDVLSLNMLQEGDLTVYKQPILDCNVRRVFEECIRKSEFLKRRQEVEAFNKNNRWKKRGIALATTTFGVGFGVTSCQQAGALVLIYKDGSVLLTHGGVEMGQGLHTKLIQIASRVLKIPIDKIYTNEVATDKVPNTTTTAGSISSDLNGMAVMRACEELNRRLEPIKKKLKENSSWEELIIEAYTQRISLSATGFHVEPEVDYDFDTNTGTKLYNYFTFGASCSEVEIDCLTGDHQVLRTDIVMDVGQSLNPGVDIGQIEGGFLQGYGYYALEEILFAQDGTMMSKGPGAYKLPGFSDIPQEFNVSLLEDSKHVRAIYSSKAVGEPPVFLAASVFFALREAVKDARKSAGVSSKFAWNAPATAEKIRMSCADLLTSKIKSCKSTWNVVP